MKNSLIAEFDTLVGTLLLCGSVVTFYYVGYNCRIDLVLPERYYMGSFKKRFIYLHQRQAKLYNSGVTQGRRFGDHLPSCDLNDRCLAHKKTVFLCKYASVM